MENHTKKYNCAGTGLLALDVLIKGKSDYNPKIFAGGSCGNVLSILSYLNFNSYPIARLGNNDATDLVFEDLEKWDVNLDFIEREEKGSTPIIIHRILESPLNEPKHRFEFRNPNNGKWLPSFRPVLAKKVESITENLPVLNVFYFDRVSRSSIELAKYAKTQGALIFFEPSSNREKKQFKECLEISDIIKFSDQRIKSYREEYPNIQTILEIETSGKEGLNYRFKSNKNNFLVLLGYSHLTYLNLLNFFKLELSKTSLLFFSYFKIHTLYNILKYRNSNIFTAKGLSQSTDIIFRKTGKVSFYI